ncbi:MAG: metal-iron-binding protein [Firmicutes bacterium]|nr:metal-iron-binding protein [Bacillota bacterium]
MRCLVCGMKVNTKNFDLNKYSFIKGNEKENIIYCPFCGAHKIYFDQKDEVYSVNKEKLDKQSLKILDMAMKLEVFNGEFYKEASKLAKTERVSKIFKDLSNIEFMHAKVHKRLGGFSKLPKLNKPDYTRHDTDRKLLDVAKDREKHAINFYKKYEEKISSEIILKIFKALTDVEKQHIEITEKDV